MGTDLIMVLAILSVVGIIGIAGILRNRGQKDSASSADPGTSQYCDGTGGGGDGD